MPDYYPETKPAVYSHALLKMETVLFYSVLSVLAGATFLVLWLFWRLP